MSSLVGGSAARWGFALYLASKNGYKDSVLPTGHSAGTPEDALDTACGLYLSDPTGPDLTRDELTCGTTEAADGFHDPVSGFRGAVSWPDATASAAG